MAKQATSTRGVLLFVGLALGLSASAHAQSLLRGEENRRPGNRDASPEAREQGQTQDQADTSAASNDDAPTRRRGDDRPLTLDEQTRLLQEPLRGISLTLVEAPRPTEYRVHDLVTIIISEQSKATSSAKLDTQKDASLDGRIIALPDVLELLQGRLGTTDRSPLTRAAARATRDFQGDGSFERSERLTDRITASVIDVKPNGTIVLEARRTIQKDGQTQVVVLSGVARRDDITTSNTVLSSQLAELVVRIESEGDVQEAAEKGWLTRAFETIFNF